MTIIIVLLLIYIAWTISKPNRKEMRNKQDTKGLIKNLEEWNDDWQKENKNK